MNPTAAEATPTARLPFSFLGANLSAFESELALDRVRSHLRQNLSRPLTLGQAARIAGLERTYFSAYFHRKVGTTFVRWVNAVRVARAIELLSDTNRGVAEIATDCGYREARSLQRNFKQLTGTTPSGFRSRIRQKSLGRRLGSRLTGRSPVRGDLRLVSGQHV